MSAQPSAKVTEAARCDSSGNHARAVSLLAEASAHGDVEAMTRLGKRSDTRIDEYRPPSSRREYLRDGDCPTRPLDASIAVSHRCRYVCRASAACCPALAIASRSDGLAR